MISDYLRILLLSVLVAISTGASGRDIPCISRTRADSLSTQLVEWQGRICPMNTLATDFTLKVCGQRRPYGYTPEQVVASWALYPETWNRAPLILVDSRELRRLLGISEHHASVAQLYDGPVYRLQRLLDQAPEGDTRLTAAITSVDERVRLVAELLGGTLIRPAPEGTAPLPAWRMRLELWNNRFPLFATIYAIVLLAAVAAFVVYIRRPE